MSQLDDVLDVAAGEIGYSMKDDPLPGSKYGRWAAEMTGESWLGDDDVAYCVLFVSWVFDRAGVVTEFFPDQNCDSVKLRAAASGCEFVPADKAAQGDLVIFDWDGVGILDHIGIVEWVEDDGTLHTIEGNTGGGYVLRRVRGLECVACVIRPDYQDESGWFYWPETDSWGYIRSGDKLRRSWLDDGGAWYYFDGDGTMLTGWQQVGGRWYYFDPERGSGNRGKMHEREARCDLPTGPGWGWLCSGGWLVQGGTVKTSLAGVLEG